MAGAPDPDDARAGARREEDATARANPAALGFLKPQRRRLGFLKIFAAQSRHINAGHPYTRMPSGDEVQGYGAVQTPPKPRTRPRERPRKKV